MKKLSTYLVLLIFSFLEPSFSDDIRDFQIEGMSIGDSALNYFSEVEIKNNVRDYYKNKKFTNSEIVLSPKFKVYDTIHINFKTNDKNYVIYSLDGTILFEENIKDCYKKKDIVVDEISKIFTSSKKEDHGTSKHFADKSGESTTTSVWFTLESGYVAVSCYDWSTKIGYIDHLRVRIISEEFNRFIDNEASLTN